MQEMVVICSHQGENHLCQGRAKDHAGGMVPSLHVA